MKAVQFTTFGDPRKVLDVAEHDEPPAPGYRQIKVDVLAAPINPSDLLLVNGRYSDRPPVPYIPGIEAVARVVEAGPGNTVNPGDHVMLAPSNNWVQRRTVDAADAYPLPADLDLDTAALVKVNPGTALSLLTLFTGLRSGDTVIQNAANSTVGLCMVSMARERGIRTVNIVRRRDAADAVTEAGGDVVVVDDQRGADPSAFVERLKAEAGDGPFSVGIDAIGGSATERLAACLDDGARLISYGALAGQPCRISPAYLIFRDIRLSGFWLTRMFRDYSTDQLMSVYDAILDHVRRFGLPMQVVGRFGFDQLEDAVIMASRQSGGNKVLLLPNGPQPGLGAT